MAGDEPGAPGIAGAGVIRIYRNNEEGTAIVEHVEMTRAELDAALSVAREAAWRSTAAEARERADRADEPGPALALDHRALGCDDGADEGAQRRARPGAFNTVDVVAPGAGGES